MKSEKKMNEEQAALYIALHHQEIGNEIQVLSSHKNFAGILQVVLNRMKSLLERNKLQKAIRLIKNIARLYRKANEKVTNLIENMIILSFSRIAQRCSTKEWQILYANVPKSFKTVYCSQNNFLNGKM